MMRSKTRVARRGCVKFARNSASAWLTSSTVAPIATSNRSRHGSNENAHMSSESQKKPRTCGSSRLRTNCRMYEKLFTTCAFTGKKYLSVSQEREKERYGTTARWSGHFAKLERTR